MSAEATCCFNLTMVTYVKYPVDVYKISYLSAGVKIGQGICQPPYGWVLEKDVFSKNIEHL
ncbi:hypothetical protein J6590_076683 [Homalodisca vitripennis]|nr:hypothetical protein J6590_076683 [Homalodisca vitripennis]